MPDTTHTIFSPERFDMATKKPTAAQLAARKRFAEMAKAGVFTKKRAKNPSPRTRRQTLGNHNGVFTVVDWEPGRNTTSGNPVFRFTLRDSHGTHYRGKTKGNAGFVYGLPRYMREGQKIDAKLSVSPMGTVTMIDGDLIKDNPKARRSVKPVTRPSQATGKRPSKRLLARRKATAKAPPGFYANPRASKKLRYVVRDESANRKMAVFGTRADALKYAQALADATGHQCSVAADKTTKFLF